MCEAKELSCEYCHKTYRRKDVSLYTVIFVVTVYTDSMTRLLFLSHSVEKYYGQYIVCFIKIYTNSLLNNSTAKLKHNRSPRIECTTTLVLGTWQIRDILSQHLAAFYWSRFLICGKDPGHFSSEPVSYVGDTVTKSVSDLEILAVTFSNNNKFDIFNKCLRNVDSLCILWMIVGVMLTFI